MILYDERSYYTHILPDRGVGAGGGKLNIKISPKRNEFLAYLLTYSKVKIITLFLITNIMIIPFVPNTVKCSKSEQN